MGACRTNVARLLGFTLCVVLVGLLLSVIVKVWVDLSWWKVFRRCVSIAASLSLVFFLWRVHHQSIRSLGLGPWHPLGKRDLLRGVLLGCGTVALMASLYLGTGLCLIAVHPNTTRVWLTLIGFIPAALLIGVLEELIFRGYVLQQLLACSPEPSRFRHFARRGLPSLRKVAAVTGSSLAYALVHIRAVPVWPQSGFELIGLFLLGVVLAIATLKTKQLYLAIGLHASLAYWARVNKLLIAFPGPSWQWLVGTNRLVNGIVTWVVLLGLGWYLSRKRPSARRARHSAAAMMAAASEEDT